MKEKKMKRWMIDQGVTENYEDGKLVRRRWGARQIDDGFPHNVPHTVKPFYRDVGYQYFDSEGERNEFILKENGKLPDPISQKAHTIYCLKAHGIWSDAIQRSLGF